MCDNCFDIPAIVGAYLPSELLAETALCFLSVFALCLLKALIGRSVFLARRSVPAVFLSGSVYGFVRSIGNYWIEDEEFMSRAKSDLCAVDFFLMLNFYLRHFFDGSARDYCDSLSSSIKFLKLRKFSAELLSLN